MSYEDEFDWGNVEVDVPHQARIAVYTNPEGHIVVRQEGDWYRKEDPWIVVLPENAKRLADAIMALAEPVLPSQLALPAPTAKGRVTGSVTDRDGTVTRDAGDGASR